MNKLLRDSLTTLSRSIRYSNWVVLLRLFGGGASGLFAASENDLHSPWDGKHVVATDAPNACPTIVHLAPDLVTDGFYRLDDPTHSII